jgi:uncharacterized MAPEG superfamily protein
MAALTIADWAILAAVGAYVLPIGIAKYSGIRSFDNANPREPGFYKDPFRARALGAHQNGMEGFAFFAAATILAQTRGAAQPLVDGLAAGYVLLRLAYIAAYLGDKATIRSVIWSTGFLVNLAIFLAPLIA